MTAATGVTSGALYPLLHRMAAEGLITDTTTTADEAADHTAGRPSRRYYEIANQPGLAHFVGDDAPLTELINQAKTELERLLSLQTNQGDTE